MPPLRTLSQPNNLNGNRNEKQKRLRRVQRPIEFQDATNKSYVDERGTYTAQADSVSTGFITLKDEDGTSRKVMTKD